MTKNVSSVGTSVEDDNASQRARSAKYRETQDRLRPFEATAPAASMPQTHLAPTQQELADRMGTTKSVISRIESGQHRSGTDTLRRLAEALNGRAVIGFEFDAAPATGQDLVRL